MTFLSALVFSLVFFGIWNISDGVKPAGTPGTNWKYIGLGAILLAIAFLLALGPISLGR